MQIFYTFVNIYANIFGNIQKLFRLTFYIRRFMASNIQIGEDDVNFPLPLPNMAL